MIDVVGLSLFCMLGPAAGAQASCTIAEGSTDEGGIVMVSYPERSASTQVLVNVFFSHEWEKPPRCTPTFPKLLIETSPQAMQVYLRKYRGAPFRTVFIEYTCKKAGRR